MLIQSRRSFITGLVSFVAAPAIVKATSLMPVKTMNEIEFIRWYPEYAVEYGDLIAIHSIEAEIELSRILAENIIRNSQNERGL